MNKVILITGTPGTGKTSIAKILAEELDYKYEHIGDHKYYIDNDEGVKIININKMIKWINNEREKNNLVIDSHLSHYYPSNKTNKCIVLRCDPAELKNRLKKRGYPLIKINTNLEAEAIDLILQEAIIEGHNIYELDTTNKTINQSAEEAINAVKKDIKSYGKIDFSYYIKERIVNNNLINNKLVNNKNKTTNKNN